MKATTLICACHSVEHQIVLRYDKDDELLYMSVHLASKSFLQRIVHSFKYLFGYQCKFGAFEEVIIDHDRAKQFIKVLQNVQPFTN